SREMALCRMCGRPRRLCRLCTAQGLALPSPFPLYNTGPRSSNFSSYFCTRPRDFLGRPCLYL
ncbi:hypothetical protein DERF_002662, partial [Dermatophagoides farinae]